MERLGKIRERCERLLGLATEVSKVVLSCLGGSLFWLALHQGTMIPPRQIEIVPPYSVIVIVVVVLPGGRKIAVFDQVLASV